MPYQMMVLVLKKLGVSVCSGNRIYLQADSKKDLFNLLIHNEGQVNGKIERYRHGEPDSIFFKQFLPCIRRDVGQPFIREQDLEVHVFEGGVSDYVKQCAIEFAKKWDRKDERPRTQKEYFYHDSKGFAVVHRV